MRPSVHQVVTVTLNPAIDHTITVDRLVPGEVHRARASRIDAGGKGVNVASVLADWGVKAQALGLLGIDNAGPFEALFTRKGIADRFLRVPGATRTNLKLVDDLDTTDINMDGPAIAPEAVAQALAAVEQAAAPGVLLILSGSLPAACPPDSYAALVATGREKGAHVVLDTSGVPLKMALAGPVLPHVMKPNRRELADWRGAPLATTQDVLREAQALRARGVELVVVSMGGEGALFVGEEGALLARLAAGPLASTVGAGDAMVAGLAAALVEGADLARTARLATAFAVAKLGRAGPHLPSLATVHALAQDVIVTAAETVGAGFEGEDR